MKIKTKLFLGIGVLFAMIVLLIIMSGLFCFNLHCYSFFYEVEYMDKKMATATFYFTHLAFFASLREISHKRNYSNED